MKVVEIAQKYELDQDKFEYWLLNSGYKVKFGFSGSTVDDSLDMADLAKKFEQSLPAEEQERRKSEKEAALQEQELLQRDRQTELQNQERLKREGDLARKAKAGMLITSGFNFDGYTITKYSGYISGDGAMSMDRPAHNWLGGVDKDVGEEMLVGLAKVRRKALEELKDAAYLLGCNAVIGVDFDYITMDPETATHGGGTLYLPFLFAVTANGNAVIIEKN
jgi:uncharacterized protein YbjQ (UPF0145 family)